MFNITKDVESKQIGGKINSALTSLFNKFRSNEKIDPEDLEKITSNDLVNDERYEAMTQKDRARMASWIKSSNKSFFVKQGGADEVAIGSNKAYFICKFCKNSKPIQPGTLLYSKSYGGTDLQNDDDYTYTIYNPTLARTRDYICKNAECESHRDEAVKEAALTKNKNHQLVYVCCACTAHWTAGAA